MKNSSLRYAWFLVYFLKTPKVFFLFLMKLECNWGIKNLRSGKIISKIEDRILFNIVFFRWFSIQLYFSSIKRYFTLNELLYAHIISSFKTLEIFLLVDMRTKLERGSTKATLVKDTMRNYKFFSILSVQYFMPWYKTKTKIETQPIRMIKNGSPIVRIKRNEIKSQCSISMHLLTSPFVHMWTLLIFYVRVGRPIYLFIDHALFSLFFFQLRVIFLSSFIAMLRVMEVSPPAWRRGEKSFVLAYQKAEKNTLRWFVKPYNFTEICHGAWKEKIWSGMLSMN